MCYHTALGVHKQPRLVIINVLYRCIFHSCDLGAPADVTCKLQNIRKAATPLFLPVKSWQGSDPKLLFHTEFQGKFLAFTWLHPLSSLTGLQIKK